jgi:hypothetical protein
MHLNARTGFCFDHKEKQKQTGDLIMHANTGLKAWRGKSEYESKTVGVEVININTCVGERYDLSCRVGGTVAIRESGVLTSLGTSM